MKISLDHISKKFQGHWVFKNVQYSFNAPGSYAILGPNGSGKSTLLRIISGMQAPSKGKVSFEITGKPAAQQEVFDHFSFCAPGMDIVEELSLKEFLEFHFTFKKSIYGLSVPEIIELTGLSSSADKVIADFSSGMKQRVKLIQAICSDTPALFLDEPCTNLDASGVAQYQNWINRFTTDRLVVVASNDEREFSFCKERIELETFQ
jgi:ABC-type multidrug transport system ATPase subunit